MDKRKSTTKVGMLTDWAAGGVIQPFFDAATLAFENALEDGVIDRAVQIVVRDVDGLPTGNVHEVLNAWKELANEGCVAIIGPHISENAIALKHYIETEGRVPSIGWPGTDVWQGEWTFALNQGSLVEEGCLMANFLAHRKARKVITVAERSAIGGEYLEYLRRAADFEGLNLGEHFTISQIEVNLDMIVEAMRATGADAVAYCGFGVPINRLARAMRKIGWQPLTILTTGFLTTPLIEGGMRGAHGFYGLDLYDEENPLTREFTESFEKRFGYRAANYYTVTGYDIANVVAHGIGYGHPISPAGVKRGMELVKYLPAVSGGPGTLISYAPYVRRGWMGKDYLVVREAIDAEGDLFTELPSRLAHRMTPRTRGERAASRRGE
ncbi:hypothetical protein BSL82_11650 [Tardibacter chloracetimidivorans]|uniref:Leucine-binding protein domain-containing protein n=2 Tax=Tardibacter chloracetimidivorans TaxID=1921510 RepID=A0A1L3ZZQ0_9SPHN|nr:hypothetical protein BSL82_11650 [Tardibacter chloracetimidivorans]